MITKQTMPFDKRYQIFVNDIRSQIKSGSIKPGDYLVSETQLAKLYQLSKMSVRRALAEIEQEGLIDKIPCIGNRVRELSPIIDTKTLKRLHLYGYEVNSENRVFNACIQLFEQQNPDVKIEFTVVPNSNYIQHILHTIEHKDDIDLFILADEHFNIAENIGKSYLLESIGPDQLETDHHLYPQTLQMFESDGVLKAMPFSFSPVVYFYNAEIVSEEDLQPLHSWDEFKQFIDKYTITDSNGIHQQLGLAFHIAPRRWATFLLQNGGALFNKEGLPFLTDEASVAAMRFFAELVHRYRITPYTQGEFRADHFLFENKKVATILSSYYYMNELHSLPFKWDVLPFFPGTAGNSTILLGSGVAMSRNCKDKQLALRFLEFLSGDEAQTLLKQSMCSLPANRMIAENREIVNTKIHPNHYHVFESFMPQSISIKELGVNHSTLSGICQDLTFLWSHMETPEAACERIEQKWLLPLVQPLSK